MANEMDTAQKSLSFFSDEVLDTLFSGIQSGVEKVYEKQQIGSSLENELSVNLDDDKLQIFLEQQKNCTTQKENALQLKNAVRQCKGIIESQKIDDIPSKELDRLLSHFYYKVRCANGSLYEPSTLTSIQRSLDRHLPKDHHKPYSIKRNVELSSSQQLLKANKKMLKKEGNGNKSKASQPLHSHTVHNLTIMCN